MDTQLFIKAIVGYLLGVLLLGLFLFLPAGTLNWFEGWLLMGLLFVPMFLAGIVMMLRTPELLRKRLSMNEREGTQRRVIGFSALMFIVAFVLAGLNFRFGWLTLPRWVVIAASVLFLIGYLLFAETLRENVWLTRTVEVQEGQRVVDTGLYGVVRHPMYMATVLLFLAMPLVLASPLSFLVMLSYLPIIRRRILNEESVLEDGLAGYREYKRRVRWRLFPGIW